ncbi:multidrug effflux MFS transporter [Caballeronia sp. LZ034LL]|uniref:multidrug effflux MFS transporter n=1 Tax=Caballeronia sp. LZ034LL TaxID=3038567 RepID=UPI00285FF59C|nr:multidrug effflux MFS transporter [Caballeronia sp. LZ034LL]MDR5836135.1 multidrug effflux MFS transporter [Caballeronia sp. LZ034LL]
MRPLTLLLAALSMLGPFATDSYLPALPGVGRQFGVSAEVAQTTLSVYLFCYAVMTLFYGMLSDSFGRRRVLLAALALFAAASVGATFAPDFGTLLAFRGVQGLSAGAGMVIGQAIVRDTLEGPAIQRTLAHIMMVFALAPAIAPVLGGQLNTLLGWRSIFGLLALFAIGLLAVCLRWLPETLPPASRHAFRLKLIVRHYADALRHRRFVLGVLANGCAFGGFALYISCAANFVMHVLHQPDTAFGWLFVPLIAGVIAGSALSARFAGRHGNRVTVRAGLGVTACAAALNLVYNAWCVAALPWAVLPLALYAFGMALAMPAMSAVTQAWLPSMRGMAASLQNFVQMFIFALISGIAPPFVFDDPQRMAQGLALAVACGIACWIAGSAREDEALNPAPSVER